MGSLRLFPGFTFARSRVTSMFAALIRSLDWPLRFAAAHDAMASVADFRPHVVLRMWRFRGYFGRSWRNGGTGGIFFGFHGGMGSLGQGEFP